jgi:hypothetical protein
MHLVENKPTVKKTCNNHPVSVKDSKIQPIFFVIILKGKYLENDYLGQH